MTDKVVLQRIGNRIIELLDLYSDEAEFTRAISAIEMWEGWVPSNNLTQFRPPVFSDAEVVAMEPVCNAWELISYGSKRNGAEWLTFSNSCSEALMVFNVRGLLSETAQIT